MHWYNFQVSILVHITYRQNPEYDPLDTSTWIFKEIQYYIFGRQATHYPFCSALLSFALEVLARSKLFSRASCCVVQWLQWPVQEF
jgi:hypothetical protein